MSKSISLFILITLLLSTIMVITPQEAAGDAMESPTRQPVRFYMYGPADDGNLSTENPTSDEDEEQDCDQEGNMQTQERSVGTWRTNSISKTCNFTGNVQVFLWAKGNVRNVQFTFRISRNGNNPRSISTNRNDTETTPKLFYGEGNVNFVDQNRIRPGDRIVIEIMYDGGETSAEGLSKQATIVYGSIDHPSGIKGPLDTMYFAYEEDDIEVRDDNAEEDKLTLIATATIRDGLGVYDIAELGFSAATKDFVGESFSHEILEEGDDYKKVQWKWRYADDNAWSGGYKINITATDNSGNVWWETHTAHIVYQPRPKIDFVLENSDITIQPTPVYVKKTGDINILLHCWGESGGPKGLMPTMIIEITPPNGTKDTFYATPSIDTNSETIVHINYFFNMTGTYTIRVEVNPKEEEYYEETNDAGTADDNNVGTYTLTVVKEPKDEDDDEWYEEIYDDMTDEPLYLGGVVAAIVVVVAVVTMVFMRRRRGRKEEDLEE
ncbi:MAG: hypothetical protein KAU14_05190 [Thermoplasmata archaeon]|nr:hypothetical protein [Thermoplasmata archaeon]